MGPLSKTMITPLQMGPYQVLKELRDRNRHRKSLVTSRKKSRRSSKSWGSQWILPAMVFSQLNLQMLTISFRTLTSVCIRARTDQRVVLLIVDVRTKKECQLQAVSLKTTFLLTLQLLNLSTTRAQPPFAAIDDKATKERSCLQRSILTNTTNNTRWSMRITQQRSQVTGKLLRWTTSWSR